MEAGEGVISNVVVVSDIHAGCRLGLYPCDQKIDLDHGTHYLPSDLQAEVYDYWKEFWGVWVPEVTRGEPYSVVVNGDTLDGRHHGAVTQISQSRSDQQKIAFALLKPVSTAVQARGGAVYVTRGTEAHVGQSGEDEENLALAIGAKPDKEGSFARFAIRMRIGHRSTAHFAHHIGCSVSTAYETTALMREFAEMLTESARWGYKPVDAVVRSHRHRHSQIEVPTSNRYGYCFTTAGWQLKTPFTWKIAGGRMSRPQFGGSVLREGDEEFYVRHYTKDIEPTEEEAC